MPRTKVNRKVLANKRGRRSSTEEQIEAKLKEFDALAYEFTSATHEESNQATEKVTEMVMQFKQNTSKKVLSMKIGDLRKMAGKTLNEVTMSMSVATHNSHPSGGNITDISTLGSLSMVGDRIGEKKRTGHQDEGYLTETTSPSRSSGRSSIKSNTSTKSGRILGPLASSKAMRQRRSQSAGSNVLATVSKQIASLSTMRATPLKVNNVTASTSHMSRTKYRTPLNTANRQKAVSVDRLIITPKVQPETPLAILRRANVGETAYSINGSPVITSAAIEEVANVNIPVLNGILSLRPTEMNSIDPRILTKIDSKTLDDLNQLQSNLKLLMRAVSNQ